MNRLRRVGGRRPHVTGTIDVTHTLHVGGIQVRADEGLVKIRLPNGTRIVLQPASETRFFAVPAAAEPVSIRPDDDPHFGTVKMRPTRDVVGAEAAPLVRTGPGGDHVRDWPNAPPPPERRPALPARSAEGA